MDRRSILFVRPARSVMAVPHLNLLADASRHGEGDALTPSCNPLPLSHDRLVCVLVLRLSVQRPVLPRYGGRGETPSLRGSILKNPAVANFA